MPHRRRRRRARSRLRVAVASSSARSRQVVRLERSCRTRRLALDVLRPLRRTAWPPGRPSAVIAMPTMPKLADDGLTYRNGTRPCSARQPLRFLTIANVSGQPSRHLRRASASAAAPTAPRGRMSRVSAGRRTAASMGRSRASTRESLGHAWRRCRPDRKRAVRSPTPPMAPSAVRSPMVRRRGRAVVLDAVTVPVTTRLPDAEMFAASPRHSVAAGRVIESRRRRHRPGS